MSDQRPGRDHEVYTMPPEAFRVGAAGAQHESERPAGPEPTRAEPAAAPEPAASVRPDDSPAVRPRRVWDLALTIVLLLVSAALSVAASFMALFIVFLSDGCGAVNCDYERLNLGLWVALSGPWIVWVIALAVSIVLLVRRRLAFWMPLAGVVLTVGVWVLGAWVAATGVG